MRSREGNEDLPSGSANTFHAGVEPTVLRSSTVVSTLSQSQGEGSTGWSDAAIGIMNGLLIGGAFWIVGGLLLGMFKLIT